MYMFIYNIALRASLSKSMRYRHICGQSGFTLVEILIAACVLAIGVVALASIFPLTVQRQEQLTYTQIAVAAARSDLEYLTYKALIATESEWSNFHTNESTSSVEGLPAGNSKVVTITNYSDDSKYLKRVTARVTWPGKTGSSNTGGDITYDTLVTKSRMETDYTSADL